MLPAIPSAINAGARGSAGGQASILESDDFGHRSAPRGACSSDICHNPFICVYSPVCSLSLLSSLISMHPPPNLHPPSLCLSRCAAFSPACRQQSVVDKREGDASSKNTAWRILLAV